MQNFEDLSISDDSADEQYERPNVVNQVDVDVSVNETADSFKQKFDFMDDDGYYNSAGTLFSKFYKEQLVRESIPEASRFENHRVFDKYRKMMEIYPPVPNLYFLPITIIFTKKLSLLALRDLIIEEIGSHVNLIYKVDKKTKAEQIELKFHTSEQMSFYRIKCFTVSLPHKHPSPECLDQNLSINPLFRFYELICGDRFKFSETCGLVLYWAYRKRILNEQYFSEIAIKIIIIYIYFNMGKGIPNIAHIFVNENKQKLNSLKRMYKVNKKLECELDEELFANYNFSIREKRGFYLESREKYSTFLEILIVPYPVEEADFLKYKKFGEVKKESKKQNEIKQFNPIAIFFNLIQYLHNYAERSEKITFDFISNRQGITTASEIDFNIEIKHPVYGNNVCQNLTNDYSKLRKIKQQIMSVVKIYNDERDPLSALSQIFSQK